MGIFLMPFALLLKFFYDFFQSYGIALILFALIIKLVLFPFSLNGGTIVGIFLMPFALLLKFFYDFFQSYGIALILFALIIKLVLFPFSLKGKKSMIQMNLLSGKMQQLQKQYGKDRERYNLEIQKLYEKEKVNPMSGCLWSFIPILFLMVLYGIIREPLTYFMGLTMEQIQLIAQELDWQTVAVSSGWITPAAMEKLVQQMADGKITSVFQNGAYNQMYLASMINPDNLAALQTLLGDAGSKLFVMDFSFLGINLASIPKWNFWTAGFGWDSIGLFLLPLVSVGISLLSMQVSLKTNQMNNQVQDETAAKTNRTMMIMMPLMSLWIGFTVPAGLSVYWIAQYIFTIFQEIICGKLLKKDYEAARAAAEERERQEKEEEKRRKEEARLERQRRLEEEKKNRGKKKLVKKDEPTEPGVNKDDSRIGIRAYARGRSYIPDRFGGVTEYRDMSELLQAQMDAEQQRKGKKDKKAAPAQEEKKEEIVQKPETEALPEQETVPAEQPAVQQPVSEIPAEQSAPVQEPTEIEEVEVEVEQVEMELPEEEDDKKEGV